VSTPTACELRPLALLRERFAGRSDCYLLELPPPAEATNVKEPPTDRILLRHLRGEKRIGIFPDGAALFLCLDFDGKNLPGEASEAWAQLRRIASVVDADLGLPPLTPELSRSRKGYHGWEFFDPADAPTVQEVKRFGHLLLRAAGLPDDEDEHAGHPGVYPHVPGPKGYGRTPYLPWAGLLAGAGSAVFLDLATGEPLDRQESALENVQLVTRAQLVGATKILEEMLRPRPAPEPPRAKPVPANRWEVLADPQRFKASRHEQLRAEALRLLAKKLPVEEVRALLRALAASHGLLPDRAQEVEDLIVGAVEKLKREGRTIGADAEPEAPRYLDLRAIIADDRPLPDVPYALRDPKRDTGPIVEGDVTGVSSEGKVGKSTTALALAFSFSTASPFAGYLDPHPEPRRVLYLDAENNERLISRRWMQLVRGAGRVEDVKRWTAEPPLVYVWGDRYNLDNEAGFDAVRRLVDTHRPAWIFFDSFIRFTRKSLLDADAMSELYLTRYRPLRDMVAGGVLYLAHLRKRSREASNDPGQRLFGSVDIRNSLDSHLALERDGDVVRVTHEATRWDDLFPPFCLRLEIAPDKSTARLVYEGEADDCDGTVRTWLREAETTGLLRQEIVRRLHESGAAKDEDSADRMATRALKRLRDGKEATSAREGNAVRYWAADLAPKRFLDA
jgi:hypothetical protein